MLCHCVLRAFLGACLPSFWCSVMRVQMDNEYLRTAGRGRLADAAGPRYQELYDTMGQGPLHCFTPEPQAEGPRRPTVHAEREPSAQLVHLMSSLTLSKKHGMRLARLAAREGPRGAPRRAGYREGPILDLIGQPDTASLNSAMEFAAEADLVYRYGRTVVLARWAQRQDLLGSLSGGARVPWGVFCVAIGWVAGGYVGVLSRSSQPHVAVLRFHPRLSCRIVLKFQELYDKEAAAGVRHAFDCDWVPGRGLHLSFMVAMLTLCVDLKVCGFV